MQDITDYTIKLKYDENVNPSSLEEMNASHREQFAHALQNNILRRLSKLENKEK